MMVTWNESRAMRGMRLAAWVALNGLLMLACGSDPAAAGVPAGAPDGGGVAAPKDGENTGPMLAVRPAKLTVPVGRSQIFVAPDTAGVTWSVLEGEAGGTVDAFGRYTAPRKAGTYHVVATAGGVSGVATLDVADYTLSILAGAVGGSGRLDGIGAAARFRQPFAVTNDGAGTLYVADTYNATIRKVNVATGAVTTLAGSGAYGNGDGVGAGASFSVVSALTVDKVSGALYAADSGNNAIRRIDVKTGTVTTLAGGNKVDAAADGIGTAAQFNSPSGIAYVDGVVYVSDTSNSTLRRIDVATKMVTTVAGVAKVPGNVDATGASARFHAPVGITVVDATLLYVADVATNSVRRVDIGGGGATYAVSTWAGAGTSGKNDGTANMATFSNPQDVAYAGGTVYVADWTNNTIRAITSGVVSTIAGVGGFGSADGVGTAAGLSRPTGLTTDGTTLWVADQYNSSIRSIDLATKKVTTLAGKVGTYGFTSGDLASTTFSSVVDLAIDASDELYLLERNGCDVRTFSFASKTTTPLVGKAGACGSVDGAGDGAQFLYPQAFALDGAGHAIVADTYNSAVRDVTLGSRAVSTPYGTLGAPQVYESIDGIGPVAHFNEPSGVVFAGGKIYVADTASNSIRQIDPLTKTVTTAFGSLGKIEGSDDGVSTAARFRQPKGLATDGNGHLFVADSANATVRMIDLTSGMVTTLAGVGGGKGTVDGLGAQARFVEPRALFWDGEESLFVADAGDSTLRRIYVPTRAVSTFAGQPGLAGIVPGPIDSAVLNAPSALVRTSKGAFVLNSGTEGALLQLTRQ